MGQIVISGEVEAGMLRDVERMTDELAAACSGSGRIAYRRQVSDVLAVAIAERSTPDGLALALDRGQTQKVRLLALDAVMDKILGQQDVRELMFLDQMELDAENAEAAQQDEEARADAFRQSQGFSKAAWPTREAA